MACLTHLQVLGWPAAHLDRLRPHLERLAAGRGQVVAGVAGLSRSMNRS